MTGAGHSHTSHNLLKTNLIRSQCVCGHDGLQVIPRDWRCLCNYCSVCMVLFQSSRLSLITGEVVKMSTYCSSIYLIIYCTSRADEVIQLSILQRVSIYCWEIEKYASAPVRFSPFTDSRWDTSEKMEPT